jgi:hypothetical protein
MAGPVTSASKRKEDPSTCSPAGKIAKHTEGKDVSETNDYLKKQAGK